MAVIFLGMLYGRLHPRHVMWPLICFEPVIWLFALGLLYDRYRALGPVIWL